MKLLSALLLACFLAIGVCQEAGRDFIKDRMSRHRDALKSMGKRSRNRNLIVGGTDADPSRYPYYAILDIETADGFFFCGAVLVHPDIILTAADCITGFTSIFTAVNYTNDITFTGFEYFREVVGTLVHPDFDASIRDYDLAALQLDFPVNQVTPVPINTERSAPANGAAVTVTGFGLLSDGGEFPTLLQEVEVNSVAPPQCRTPYPNYRANRQICANAPGRVSSKS